MSYRSQADNLSGARLPLVTALQAAGERLRGFSGVPGTRHGSTGANVVARDEAKAVAASKGGRAFSPRLKGPIHRRTPWRRVQAAAWRSPCTQIGGSAGAGRVARRVLT